MLTPTSEIHGYTIAAVDGKIGQVSDVLFGDKSWLIRWVVIETGTWLSNRKVLLPPLVMGHPNNEKREFKINLSCDQVRHSPDIDTDKPVSRQLETTFFDYYDLSPYWGTGLYLGAGSYLDSPIHSTLQNKPTPQSTPTEWKHYNDGLRLRSASKLSGYHIQASN